MLGDPYVLNLIDTADRYKCEYCGKGIEDDECDAEQVRRMGEKMLTEAQYEEMLNDRDKEIRRLHAVTNVQLETLTDLENRLEREQAEFKNFHRALCERFNYCHDQVDWKRDQVSLIEHIAEALQSSQSQVSDYKSGEWHAGRLAGIEEAANVCCDVKVIAGRTWHAGTALAVQNQILNAIRALQSSTPDKKGGE